MLPPALLHVANRLIATLMTLVRAVATTRSAPTFPSHAAQTLFVRLSKFIATLVRISTIGVRTPAQPKSATPARLHPAPLARRARPNLTVSLPRRPGWLLDALPDTAPAIAADLEAILADPAIAAFLGAAPTTLHRTLRPLLHGLGLTASPPAPDASLPRRPSSARPSPKPHHAPRTVPVASPRHLPRRNATLSA